LIHFNTFFIIFNDIQAFSPELSSRHHFLKSTGLQRYLDLRRNQVDAGLDRMLRGRKPGIIYDPLRHVLKSGGKRMRAILVLLACEAVGGDRRRALPAALAVECLHNFTLIHDDVMDDAPVRRGRQTIHSRWNEAVAILAGDQLLALGFEALAGAGRTPPAKAVGIYTGAFIDVCDGQGYDLEFEGRAGVSMKEYTRMIDLKTARVIAAAVELGGLYGGGSAREVRALRRYGERLGLAFQVMDDLLDVVGTTRQLGKKIGGDIARGKKTYLQVKAMERSRGADRALLRGAGAGRMSERTRFNRVSSLYARSGAVDSARDEIIRLTRGAKKSLAVLPPTPGRRLLVEFADRLAGRTS
jgi:geranylgeranyl diphosphate synthase type II